MSVQSTNLPSRSASCLGALIQVFYSPEHWGFSKKEEICAQESRPETSVVSAGNCQALVYVLVMYFYPDNKLGGHDLLIKCMANPYFVHTCIYIYIYI